MTWNFLIAMLVALPVDESRSSELLLEDFGDGPGRFFATDGVAVAEGAARLGPGAALTSRDSIDGDLQVDIALGDALGSDAVGVGLAGGEVELRVWVAEGRAYVSLKAKEVEVTAHPFADVSAPRSLTIRNRSYAIEVSLDGKMVFDHVMTRPVPGGALTIAATTGPIAIDSLRVRRLGWFDGVQVEGLDDASRYAARGLGEDSFRLLDPPPSRIDPEFRVAFGDAGGAAGGEGPRREFVVRFAGIRPVEDDAIPLLTQALAFSGIRPYLAIRVWGGDGPEDKLPIAASEDGSYFLEKAPGVIEASTLTWMGDVWPSATAWDVTNDRLLDRCVPAGPARRDIFTHIPEDCDEVKITLAGPGTPTIEDVIRIERPEP